MNAQWSVYLPQQALLKLELTIVLSVVHVQIFVPLMPPFKNKS